MLTHELIWSALDALAKKKGLSASGLASRAGLDATTFSPSKRIGSNGRKRWPGLETIAKVLDATDTDLLEFLAMGERRLAKRSDPRE